MYTLPMTLLILAFCGLLGVFSRYAVDLYISRYTGPFPVGTLLINLAGAFIAAVVFVASVERQLLSYEWRTGLIVGFCGGFTTFSAYALQTLVQWEAGEKSLALLYFVGSPVLGLACAYAGLQFGRLIFSAT